MKKGSKGPKRPSDLHNKSHHYQNAKRGPKPPFKGTYKGGK